MNICYDKAIENNLLWGINNSGKWLHIGTKKALSEALDMGLINAISPINLLESEGVKWAREILQNSPTAIKCLKFSFNADTDGLAGIQELAGQATHLFYTTDESKEGRNAFMEKRVLIFVTLPFLIGFIPY